MKFTTSKTKFQLSKIPIILTLIILVGMLAVSMWFDFCTLPIPYIIMAITLTESASIIQKGLLFLIFSNRISKLRPFDGVANNIRISIVDDNYDFFGMIFVVSAIIHISIITFTLFLQNPNMIWPQILIVSLISIHIFINMKLANKYFDLEDIIKEYKLKGVYWK